MLNPVQLVFYSVFLWYIRTESPTLPALTAGMITAVLLLLNCLTIAILMNLLLDPSNLLVAQLPHDHRPIVYLISGAVGLVLGALIASYWAPGGDISRLEQKFGNVSERTKRR